MATYTCAKCGMGVNATCAKCDSPLENDSLDLGGGNSVQISKCPNGHGQNRSQGQLIGCPWSLCLGRFLGRNRLLFGFLL